MSIQAMSAVLALPGDLVSPTQRLVLISIANHANKEGHNSFPARETVSEETGLSVRTVTRATAKLRWMGLLRVAEWPGRGEDGRFNGSVVYDLNVPGLSPPRRQSVPRSRGQRVTRTEGQTGGHSVPVTEEPKKRKKQSFPQDIGKIMEGMGFDG